MRWLYSFLSADRRKTYCLYEAPSPDAIRRAAARAGVPADVVVEMADASCPTGHARACSRPDLRWHRGKAGGTGCDLGTTARRTRTEHEGTKARRHEGTTQASLCELTGA